MRVRSYGAGRGGERRRLEDGEPHQERPSRPLGGPQEYDALSPQDFGGCGDRLTVDAPRVEKTRRVRRGGLLLGAPVKHFQTHSKRAQGSSRVSFAVPPRSL